MSSPLINSSSPKYNSMDSPLPSPTESDSFSLSMSQSGDLHSDAFTIKNEPIHISVSVSASSISYTNSATRRSLTHSIDDLVGCILNSSSSRLSLNFYPRPTDRCCGSDDRTLEAWELETSDETAAKSFHSSINKLIYGLPIDAPAIPRRQIFVLANPASGSGQAVDRARSVEPMLKHSGISYQIILTTHAGHAKEFLSTLNFDEFDSVSVICSSGDGLVHEAINGIFDRPDWQRAVEKVHFGTIGGGSGNGLAKNLTETSGEKYSAINAAFIAVKGFTRPFDIFTCVQPGQKPRIGFLSISWAIVSDIDFESEKWRCCGGARFTFAALWTMFCNLRQYKAELSILHPTEPSPGNSGERRLLPHGPKCEESRDCTHCGTADQREIVEMANYLDRIKGEGAENRRNSLENKSAENSKQRSRGSVSINSNPPANAEVPENWESISDAFTVIWAMNVPYAATDMLPAPMAHCSDGLLDLVFVRDIRSCPMLGFMLKLEKGQHIDSERLEYVKCKGMKLKATDDRHCVMGIDGERLEESEVEVRCWRGIIKVHGK